MGSIADAGRAAQAQAPDLNPARIYATRREVK
jgi:hypothetical protein